MASMRYQPQGRPVIDWSNPITAGLVSLLWAGDSSPRDLLNPSLAFTANGVTASAGTRGKGYTLATRSAGGIYGPRGGYGKAQLQFPLSLFWVGEVTADTSGNGAFAGVGDGGNGGFSLRTSYGNRLALIKLSGSSAVVGNVAALATGPSTLALTADGTTARLYEKGSAKETAAVAGTVAYDLSFGRMELFGNVPDGAVGAAGSSQFQAVWNRALSAAEVQALASNPWQLFAAPDDEIDVVAAPTSITGTLAWTEVDDALSIGGVLTDPALEGWTEADDAHALAGTVTDRAALAWTEADDSQALISVVTDSDALWWIEADDAVSIAGTVASGGPAAGALSWTEADDVHALAGGVAVAAALGWAETSDGVSITGNVPSSADTHDGGFVTRESLKAEKRRQAALTKARDEKDARTNAARDTLRQAIREAASGKPAGAVAPPVARAPAPARVDEDDEDEELLLLLM